jgi:hypothetical protein
MSRLPLRSSNLAGIKIWNKHYRPFRFWKFFFTLYHAGKVNIILHVVSFSFLFYGLTVKSVPLVLIGLFIFDEMGHGYNHFVVPNRGHRFGLRMIPCQLLDGPLIMLVLLKLFGWLQTAATTHGHARCES